MKAIFTAVSALIIVFSTLPPLSSKGADSVQTAFSSKIKEDPDTDWLIKTCGEYISQSRFDMADTITGLLFEAASGSNDSRASLYANLYKGLSSLLSHSRDSAEVYLGRALEAALETGDEAGLCQVYNAYGIWYIDKKMDFRKGIEYFLLSIEHSKGRNLDKYYLSALNNLATAYNMRNDPAGLKYAEEVYAAAKESGYGYISFCGAVTCAYIHCQTGNHEKALPYIEEVMPEIERYGHKMEVYTVYASILYSRGESIRAKSYYELAVRYLDDNNVAPTVMTCLNYGSYLCEVGRYGEAVPFLQRGIGLSLRRNYTTYLRHLFKNLSDAYAGMGDYRNSLMFFKEFHAVSDSIFNVEREESINHLRIQYEAERQENMLRKQEIDFVKQRRRLHVTLLILLLLMVISVSIYILYRRKDRLYRQIVIQQHEFLQKEKRMAAQIQPPSPETEKNGHDEDLFGKIEYLMQTEHLYRQNGFSIENLAEKIGINRTYLSRAINRSAGKSFSSYINDYRINEAVRRLSDINEDIPLKALATSLGYNHIQTFYTSFQNSIGMPPAQYRKRLVKLRKEQHF